MRFLHIILPKTFRPLRCVLVHWTAHILHSQSSWYLKIYTHGRTSMWPDTWNEVMQGHKKIANCLKKRSEGWFASAFFLLSVPHNSLCVTSRWLILFIMQTCQRQAKKPYIKGFSDVWRYFFSISHQGVKLPFGLIPEYWLIGTFCTLKIGI